MKQFFKFFFASLLGCIVGFVVLLFLISVILSAVVSSFESSKDLKLEPHSVLELNLKNALKERSSKNPFADLDISRLKANSQPGLYDMVRSIDRASADENIDGILFNSADVQSGWASLEELRNALLRFRKSGKWILAYSPSFSQGSYYVATAADQVVIHPEGALEFRGMVAEYLYLKGLMEKLEIEPQVIRHGKFKSAAESLVSEKMSDENRAQIKSFVDDFWNHFLAGVSQARNKSVESLNEIAGNLKALDAGEAYHEGLVDSLMFDDQAMNWIRKKTNQPENKKLQFVSISKYSRSRAPSQGYVREKIAVVFAAGAISEGEGDEENIGSETLGKAICKAREDSAIKAVVLRVNSPGGSALASDIIWREVYLTRQVKPVVVSMGDVAASGGYYISCAANKILVQPNTITGSIGVIGVIWNLQNFMKNKLGITSDLYKTSPMADIGFPTRPLNEAELKVIQNLIEKTYQTFTTRVADGRKMSVPEVDSIGQGRVWSGEDALQLGLADSTGNLNDAITLAAQLAGIQKYRVAELPELKEPLQELLSELNAEVSAGIMKKNFGLASGYWDAFQAAMKCQGIQMRLPFDFIIR